ncbi:TetR/AcrR family transcriptional regulator [Lactiplantibacillus plantarum]|uniref:TetR/AcrR family transcriptional regulator n=1 Tax=Lactiplantibacillus plantarum TaxID=1590 RepID=UPI0007BAF79B|nr:TetR/AcrR family transcriptional regulator [Lactiplantibacillus plantarum]AYE58351.1 TetR/AcrR family transcriptional regulator [Lactiplantibacillus plantarum]KZU57624.1 Transcriptional regulator TetR family [Lactiplantibacillus plantarum]MCG0574853.1 TetR/AcrR family transcriptional regulator [Lactiplantibacillus plantarum]MCG0732822.1 TetR/AcrR family transcriptional regulator [Lactiplantibacillus plantarum]QBJ56028.1 TetR/AcrR family transcriptional regulator [Lactiplantibacillus plantar
MGTQQERIQQTDEAIIKALLTVGKTKPLAQITISDITRVSGINRGTFYLHYLDKNDLVTQLTTRLLNQIQTILNHEMAGTMDYHYFSIDRPYPIITHLVHMIGANKARLHFLLSANGDPEFYVTVTNKLQTAILKELQQMKGSRQFRADIPDKYAIRLITNAILTIITMWIESSDDLTETAIAQLIMKSLYVAPYQMLGLGLHPDKP